MVDEDFSVYIEDYRPGLRSSSKVHFRCSCESLVSLSWKQLKCRIRKGFTLRCRSCSIKKKWKDTSYGNKVKASMKRAWSDPDLRSKASKTSKDTWKDPDYVEMQRAIHADPEYLKETSERSRNLWKDSSFRKRQAKIRSDPEWIRKQSESLRRKWRCSDYRGKVSSSLAKTFGEGFRSSLEITTSNLLTVSGISFEEQKPVGPYIFDFYIPSENTYIECQGEYWHSLDGAAARDAAKFTYLEKVYPKARILYLHEKDFMNPLFVKRKLDEFFFCCPNRNDVTNFSFSDLSIVKLDAKLKRKGGRSAAQEFLDSYHYAQFGRSAKIVYGAFLGEELLAICKFSTPVRKEVATSMGIKLCEVLELDRFCIKPGYHQKNFSSWMLSRCVRFVFDEFPVVSCLVSFADTTMGHVGTIYLASNWTRYGIVPPDYHYVNEDGWIMHKKTLYNHASKNGMKEADYARLFQYRKVWGKEKIKFIMKRKT